MSTMPMTDQRDVAPRASERLRRARRQSFALTPVDVVRPGRRRHSSAIRRKTSTAGWRSRPTARVTAFTGKCELGQGLYTAQTQLVAEELCVPIERVKLIQCQTGTTPDQGVTSGAQSHPQNFNHANLALAGATAREALLQMASKHFGVPVDQLDRSRRRRQPSDAAR